MLLTIRDLSGKKRDKAETFEALETSIRRTALQLAQNYAAFPERKSEEW
jgi:hypothetical protein